MRYSKSNVIFHEVDDLSLDLGETGKFRNYRLTFYENTPGTQAFSYERYYNFQLFVQTFEPNSDGDVESGPCEPDWYWCEFDEVEFEFANPVPDDWSSEEQVKDFIIDAFESSRDNE